MMRPHLHNQAHHDRYQHSEKPGHTSDGWWMTTRILHQDDHGLLKTDLDVGVQVVLSCGQGDLDWGAGGREGQLVSPLPPPYSPLYLPAGGCLTSAQLEFIIFFVQLLFGAISTLLYSVICYGHWTTEWIFEESGSRPETKVPCLWCLIHLVPKILRF